MAPWASAPVSRGKIKVFVRVQGESDETCLRQIYNPVLDMIDPNTDVIDFIDDVAMDGGKWPLVLFGGCKDMKARVDTGELMMPSIGLVLLLQEPEIVGSNRLENITGYFQKPPWKFHHSEWVAAHRIKAYPYNSLDYFFVAEELPVCSVRQVHGTKEHLRILRYVTHDNWTDSFNLYKLIINREPEYYKSDFCVFTVETHKRYTVQFAMKRLPKGISLAKPSHTVLSFQVADADNLMPLLPHKSHKLSDIRWQTTDLDGNDILLEFNPARRRQKQRPRSRAKSCSSRRSSSSTTSSFASVLFDTAQEFIEADDTRPHSVFSEPYAYTSRKEFGLDESSSSSTTHSVLGIEASRFSFGGSPGGTSMQARSRTPIDVAEHVATSESRRFAWVREMMEADSQLRPNGHSQLHDSRQHHSNACGFHNGSHQHTDSGFADDRSEEGERHAHVNKTKCSAKVRHDNHVNPKHGSGSSAVNSCQVNHNNTWHGSQSMPRRHRTNSHGSGHKLHHSLEPVDPCDEEVERMRLLQSRPDLAHASETPRTQSGPNLSQNTVLVTEKISRGRAGSLQESLRCRRTSDILPNRVEVGPGVDQFHVSAYQRNVLNVRAREGVCPQSAGHHGTSQDFGVVPPRSTSTPLIQHSPGSFEIPPTGVPEESNIIRHTGPEQEALYDEYRSGFNENRSAGPIIDISRSPKTCAANATPSRRFFPDIGIDDDASAHGKQYTVKHSQGQTRPTAVTPKQAKQSAFVAVQPQHMEAHLCNGHSEAQDNVNNRSNKASVVTAEVHQNLKLQTLSKSNISTIPKSSLSKRQSACVTPTSPVLRTDIPSITEPSVNDSHPVMDESFEEAAIDCPVSFMQPNKSRPTFAPPDLKSSKSNIRTGMTYSGPTRTREGHAVPKHDSGCKDTVHSTSVPTHLLTRSKSASKMVTFAEVVQEKDISICLEESTDDVFDTQSTSKQNSVTQPEEVGFWI